MSGLRQDALHSKFNGRGVKDPSGFERSAVSVSLPAGFLDYFRGKQRQQHFVAGLVARRILLALGVQHFIHNAKTSRFIRS
jgi:hypothetical protein